MLVVRQGRGWRRTCATTRRSTFRRRRPRTLICVRRFGRRPCAAAAMELVLGGVVSISPRPMHCVAGVPAALLWREDGTELPLLSGLEGVGAVEPGVRGPVSAARWRGDLQPGADAIGIARHPVAGGLSVRRDPRLRRSRAFPCWPMRWRLGRMRGCARGLRWPRA